MKTNNVVPFILPRTDDPFLQTQSRQIMQGTVENRDENRFIVRLEDGRVVIAARSAGCLIVPGKGDLVLTYVGSGRSVYVLTVLESGQTETTMAFDGEVVMKAPRVRLEGGESLALKAPDMDLSAVRGRIGFFSLDLVVSALEARICRCGAVLENIRLTARSLIQTLGNSLKRVNGMDTTQAAQMRVQVAESYRLKAKSADLRAQSTMNVDGERINIG